MGIATRSSFETKIRQEQISNWAIDNGNKVMLDEWFVVAVKLTFLPHGWYGYPRQVTERILV